MSNILDIIQSYLAENHISIRSFEQSIGASNGVISRALKKHTDIQSKWMSNIFDVYPEIKRRIMKEGQLEAGIVEDPGVEYKKRNEILEIVEMIQASPDNQELYSLLKSEILELIDEVESLNRKILFKEGKEKQLKEILKTELKLNIKD